MTNRKLVAGVAGLCLAVGTAGVAVAAAPSSTTVKESQTFKMVPNRYIQDGLRFNKDVYKVKSGGTVNFVFNVTNEGPHTLTIVSRKDLPKTAKAINNCAICNKLAQAHGADPNTEAPPKFQYLEDGTGENDHAPDLNKPGDSGVFMTQNKGEKISFKVTAKKGSQLYFMCLIHPWMQAKIQVQ
jgi:plastocyanin